MSVADGMGAHICVYENAENDLPVCTCVTCFFLEFKDVCAYFVGSGP